MSGFTAEQIKALRERTGVGIAKCKEALEVSGGNMEEAIDHLRKVGAAVAVKKQTRPTHEGMIQIVEQPDRIAALKVDCETDFVSSNEKFREFVDNLALDIALTAPKDIEELCKKSYSKEPSLTVEEVRVGLVQRMGENIQIDQFALFEKASHLSIGFYVHGRGKMAAVVELEGAAGFELLAKEMAMHAVAAAPSYLDSSEIPCEVLEREKQIIREQIKMKPAALQENIIQGKLQAFYEDVCFVCQKYIKDPSLSVKKYLSNHNPNLKIKRYLRWQLGT